MHRPARHHTWALPAGLLLALTLAAPGCKNEVKPRPALDAVASPADLSLPELRLPQEKPALPKGLRAADRPPIGQFLLPERGKPSKLANMGDIYELEASLTEVMDFYRRQGCKVVRNPAGATVYPKDGDGILQVLQSKGRKLELVFIPTTKLPEPAEPPPPAPTGTATAEERQLIKERLSSGNGNLSDLMDPDTPL